MARVARFRRVGFDVPVGSFTDKARLYAILRCFMSIACRDDHFAAVTTLAMPRCVHDRAWGRGERRECQATGFNV